MPLTDVDPTESGMRGWRRELRAGFTVRHGLDPPRQSLGKETHSKPETKEISYDG